VMTMVIKLVKPPGEPSPRTLPETLVIVDEEQSCLDIIQPAPLSAPRWAPNVIVVNDHMPQGGLSWGRWTLSDPEEGRHGEDRARKTLQTWRATQVRGPCEEVKPLLLPV
jgi:hypothetical protein